MSGLDCEKCTGKLRLIHANKIMTLANKKKIGFANTPLLVCSSCKKGYIPYMTKDIINGVVQIIDECSVEDEKPESVDIIEKEEYEEERKENEVN